MIIGLGFKARSGKDTAAEYLWKQFGFSKLAFSDSLKKACISIFRLTEDQVYGNLKEVEDPFWKDTPRNILQRVGTECLRRGYREDVWIRSLERRIQLCGWGNDWVVTDVRFPNEAEAIRRWGGKLVLVDRPDAPGIATNQHASETSMAGWDSWDYVLRNHGDLPEFYVNIEVMMRSLKGKNDLR